MRRAADRPCLPVQAHAPLSLRAQGNTQEDPEKALDLPFTNFTQSFQGTLDYIWYSHDQLEVVAALAPADQAELARHTAIPSMQFPSDHLPLAAEFRLLPTGAQGR